MPETPESVESEQPAAQMVKQEDNAGRAYHVLDDPLGYVVIALGVILTTALPVFLGQRFCLPLLNTLVIFPFFVWAMRAGRPRRAITLGTFWAICQTIAMLVASLALPQQASNAVLNGLEMRSQALAWTTGGAHSPEGFVAGLPFSLSKQLIQLAVVAAGSLLTAGLVGLLVDALTLNATSYIAASVLHQANNPLLALVTAWPLWIFVRLAGYLLLGAVLAEPLAVGASTPRPDDEQVEPAWTWTQWWRRRRRLLGIGVGLALLGIALQSLLGPLWASLMRQLTS